MSLYEQGSMNAMPLPETPWQSNRAVSLDSFDMAMCTPRLTLASEMDSQVALLGSFRYVVLFLTAP